MEKPPRPQLDRAAWVQAALDTLADEGVTGIRVEVLAKRLHVTKGSFYWHFKDRQDLLAGVLDVWKEGRIRDIIKQTRPEPGKEQAQLFHVIDVYSASRNKKGILIELAMREWARRDSLAAATVEEVDAWRLRCARELFLAIGLPLHEASTRSMLLYAYVFGVSMMNCEKFDGDIARMKADILELTAKHKRTTYDRIRYWVSVKGETALKAEFYSLSNRLLKVCKYENFQTMEGRPRPTRLVMEDALKAGNVSVLEYNSMKLRDLPDKIFTKDYLKKLD